MSSPIEEIKSRLAVAEVVGSYVRLFKAGANFKAACPFHNEKTPSFFVSPARDIWHCFGCGAGGDIFRFVGQIEGVEFPEALEILAARAGVQLKKEDPRLLTERKRFLALLEEAAKYFEGELAKRKDVLAYLEERGLTHETIKNFRIGYALQSWEGLLGHLAQKGFRGEETERAGLAIISQRPEAKSRFYDRFRARIMFPISDGSARIIGFSGRIFERDLPKGEAPENAGGKYINTPQTALFDKSRVLYLWDRAKNEIRKEGACILVEGQMDALLSHQAGVQNAVATSGTALGREHLRIIRRLSQKLLLAFDADQAGVEATRRGVDLALLEGFDVNIIEVPSGKDPAETIRENPSLWRETVKKARPVIAFFLENLEKKFSGDQRRLRTEANALILPYLALIENAIEKAHWVQEISKALALREEPIWEELKKFSERNKKEASLAKISATPPEPPKTRRDLLEERILGMLAWKKSEFLEKLEEKNREFFSEHHRPLLECVLKEKLPPGSEELKANLEKLALESELLYGEMPASPDASLADESRRASQGGDRVHEEFHTLVTELGREHVRGRLEVLAGEIRRLESAGEETKLIKHLEEFKELSQKLKS